VSEVKIERERVGAERKRIGNFNFSFYWKWKDKTKMPRKTFKSLEKNAQQSATRRIYTDTICVGIPKIVTDKAMQVFRCKISAVWGTVAHGGLEFLSIPTPTTVCKRALIISQAYRRTQARNVCLPGLSLRCKVTLPHITVTASHLAQLSRPGVPANAGKFTCAADYHSRHTFVITSAPPYG